MTPTSKHEYLLTVRQRYAQASHPAKSQILDEFCATTGYHRKCAIQVLNGSPPAPPHRRCRAQTYGHRALTILTKIWEAAGYPWSVRVKAPAALLPGPRHPVHAHPPLQERRQCPY